VFTGKFTVDRLQNGQVTDAAVASINALLKHQRTDAKEVTKQSLLDSLSVMVVMVARNDGEQIVGIGVLTFSGGINFKCAEIRHLVVAEGLDVTSLGIRIVSALLEVPLRDIDFVDGGSWMQTGEMKEIFVALQFKEKPDSRFRLRLNK